MRILFSSLLFASLSRAARAASVSVDGYRDPYAYDQAAVEVEDATGVGGGSGGSGEEREECEGSAVHAREPRLISISHIGPDPCETNLSSSFDRSSAIYVEVKGVKVTKGGKTKSKTNKAHKASKYVGLENCLTAYQAILSNGNYKYSGAGVCLDDIAVKLTCKSSSKCSYAEHSLHPGSTYAMETCATFNPSDEIVYDAGSGTCTLGAEGIDLKSPRESSCRVPTAQLSFKMTFDAMDSSRVHIDFSRNGGDTFYTEEEGDSTRVAVPESLFERSLQDQGECGFVDLSKDFERVETALAQPLAERIPPRDNAFVRAVLVLENGKIVGEYKRDDVQLEARLIVHSLTKGLISLAIGKLIAEDFRKRVTIRELLTMTSGLHSGASIPPGDNLNEALYNPIFHPQSTNKGYNYMFRNNILSYVIYAMTCRNGWEHCKIPLEYFVYFILPSLGVTDIATCPIGSSNIAYDPATFGLDTCDPGDEFAWFKNAENFIGNGDFAAFEGMEGAFAGMVVTVNVMAKFGQLYLQGGKSAPGTGGDQVVPESWIEQTWTPHEKKA
ncbi:hypothetical protein THAOC_00091 [Thalassiosira oceanica]|uniref:Beta-lactamase-related domain-containing protein n=1 Tax=Thalassiosira oceanica TaxID=159749 RepID=K0TGZ1_THAOC|nr:hypothetical protein THAOC_00091 [Thalassiosira oceanica]|eukprot:EJK78033.1 hypothetical protein THAOC_00091 [Thalassiosira oceanica]